MKKTNTINFTALEKELLSALEADKKYKRENDAKFRALHQNVASYEEFRDIVLASHLKPLDKQDINGAPRKQPWNSVASAKGDKDTASCDTFESQAEFQPRTASEFSRDWRRFRGSLEEKYRLLVTLGGVALQDIFRAEVGFGLLGEFIVILSQGLKPGDKPVILEVLEGLSRTPRFSLNVSLLSHAEKEECTQLFHNLQGAIGVQKSSTQNLDENLREVNVNQGFGETSDTQPRSSTTEDVGAFHERLKCVMELYGAYIISQ